MFFLKMKRGAARAFIEERFNRFVSNDYRVCARKEGVYHSWGHLDENACYRYQEGCTGMLSFGDSAQVRPFGLEGTDLNSWAALGYCAFLVCAGSSQGGKVIFGSGEQDSPFAADFRADAFADFYLPLRYIDEARACAELAKTLLIQNVLPTVVIEQLRKAYSNPEMG